MFCIIVVGAHELSKSWPTYQRWDVLNWGCIGIMKNMLEITKTGLIYSNHMYVYIYIWLVMAKLTLTSSTSRSSLVFRNQRTLKG